MATHKPKPSEPKKARSIEFNDDETDVDEATFLFEDDEEDFEPEDEKDFNYDEDWD